MFKFAIKNSHWFEEQIEIEENGNVQPELAQ